MRIALFSTCLADVMFPQAAQATVSLLERLGHEVVFPEGQVCCGQMHANTGYFEDAAKITRNHVKAFEPVLDGEWDAIVVPSGSCTGAARHEQKLVAEHVGDAQLAKRSQEIAKHTYDLTELITDVLGLEDVGAYFPHTVTYHPTCHSMRIAHVGDRPYRRPDAHRSARRRSLLWFRRHLLDEELRNFNCDACRQGRKRDVYPGRGSGYG